MLTWVEDGSLVLIKELRVTKEGPSEESDDVVSYSSPEVGFQRSRGMTRDKGFLRVQVPKQAALT